MSYAFAQRVLPLRPEGAYAVLARARALEAQGRDIIHLEIGQPDFPTPAHVAQAGVDAILAGRTRYTPPAGTADLRAAIAEVAGRQRGLAFSPEEVVVGPGAKPAIFFPLLALIEPGDEVILPDPGFPSYAAAVRVAGGVPVPVRLRPGADGGDRKGSPLQGGDRKGSPLQGGDRKGSPLQGGDRGLANRRGTGGPPLRLDVAELAARVGPRTRLIILNSPSNPTGGVIPPADLEQIAALARQADLWVLSDEIYSQLVYEGEALSIATLPGMRERTIIVDGFSKTYAMTGWRLGFGIMPRALAERVELLLTHSVGCTSDFTQAAGVAALRGEQSTVAAMRASFRERRDRTAAALNTIPGVRCPVPEGAFYLFPDVRSFGRSSRELAEYLLDEAGVALLPGSDFGSGGEGYLRISYATAWERIEIAVVRMRAALARFSSSKYGASLVE